MTASRLACLIVTLAAAAAGAHGQDFTIDWHTIDGGGEMFSAGGDFELSGTIGQPDAGDTMTGGDFELTGGFWAIGSTSSSCDPCDMDCVPPVNALDIEFFIGLLFDNTDPCCGVRGEVGSTGDVNGDGSITAADIEGFINCLFP